jgi:antirestriction protein ArdC
MNGDWRKGEKIIGYFVKFWSSFHKIKERSQTSPSGKKVKVIPELN